MSDVVFSVEPSADEFEAAAITSAITLYLATLKADVDKAEEKSNSWVIKHRFMARN